MQIARVIYAAAGPADLISAHQSFKAGKPDPSEVALTFSGQIEEFCADINAEAYLISVHPSAAFYKDGTTTIEHRPKRHRAGIFYHFEELRYGFGLLITALKWRADVAILDSGTTHFFLMGLFRVFGIKLIPVLHNALWSAQFRPKSRAVKRMIGRLNEVFWRIGPTAAIGVSAECIRQIGLLAPIRNYSLFEIKAQFRREFFAQIAAAPSHESRPFKVLFVGRIDAHKGALDIPAMARWIEDRQPGLVQWEICGGGRYEDELKITIARYGVQDIVRARGWTSPRDQCAVYSASHAAIVPTRSTAGEGFAMTAAEAILAERPLVTNLVVPALELLAPAAVAAKPDDYISHAEAVLELATNKELYERLRMACRDLQAPFYDRSQGLRQGLHNALQTTFAETPRR